MRRKKNILEKVVMAVDLPGEPLPGKPLVEIAGERRVLVENHHGVILYGETEIWLRVCYGCIKIMGCNLRLMQMTKYQVIITGRIDSVALCRGAK